MKNKIYIGLITDNSQFDNIKALTEVYDYFDGLVVTYHSDGNSKEEDTWKLLNERKKDGFINVDSFIQNHAHSMNRFLLDPRIVEYRDWILLRDSAERINTEFAANIRGFLNEVIQNNIQTVYNYSKCLLFQKTPDLFFHGTPHWGLQGVSGNNLALETFGGIFANETNYCYSVRGETRPQDHWIGHFLKYYLYQVSNHMLLGNENNHAQYYKSESMRRGFRSFLINECGLGPVLKHEDLIAYWKNNPLTDKHKEFINKESILNNAYHYFVKEMPYASVKNNNDNKITIDVK